MAKRLAAKILSILIPLSSIFSVFSPDILYTITGQTKGRSLALQAPN
jgi:hypothetical protein